ncbi:hypothetical protein OSB04_028558 [Centaurea solstitialis]|uniref:Uncharacterized protein n=1 Tax=Centaurea solstitialis TaxID=347529 RepID=A0AA38SZI8_9ASTR|nr:hypothetical protein OSB04_028558 [Centaurea solstitialis]
MNPREALAIGSDTRPPVLHVHEEESDEEMNDIKKALALITKSMSQRNARKPMSSNNHRRRVEHDGRAGYQKPEEKAKSGDKGKEVKKDNAWLRMSSDDEEGGPICMLDQDEAWDLTSDEGREDQLCLMANNVEDELYSEDGGRDFNDLDSDHSESPSEVLPDPYIELENQVKDLALKVSEYDKKIKKANNMTTIAESKLASEHALVVKFSIELAHSKDKVNMLTLANKTLEDKVASLNDNITEIDYLLSSREIKAEHLVQYLLPVSHSIRCFGDPSFSVSQLLSCSLCNQSRLLQIGSGFSVETEDEELQSRGSLEVKMSRVWKGRCVKSFSYESRLGVLVCVLGVLKAFTNKQELCIFISLILFFFISLFDCLDLTITDLQKKLHEVEVLSRVSVQKYEAIFAQRTNLFAKIKDMEDKFLKRGQTDQTIHMNQPKEFNYYNPKEGIGYKSPSYLKRAISKTRTMYDLRYMSLGYKIVFMKEYDAPEQLKEEKDRKNKHSIPFNYTSLNASYATREIPLSKDYTPSYTEAEMNQEVPILSKIFSDNKTFFEKRIATLEAKLEDERRMSLREKDLFLSRINELEIALKSNSPSKDKQSTFGTRDNLRHHHHALNVDAPHFRPSSTYTQNSQSIILRSPIYTTISYMDDLSIMAPKSTVQISEIVSDDCTNRVSENGRSPDTSKPGNIVPPKPTQKDKGKDKVITPESEVASSSRSNVNVPKKNKSFRKPKNSSKPKGHSHNFHPKNNTSHSNSQNVKSKNHTSRNVRDDHLRNDRHRAKENGTKEGNHLKPFAHKPRFTNNRFHSVRPWLLVCKEVRGVF